MDDDVIFRDSFLDLWKRILPQLRDVEYDIFYGYNWRNRGGRAENIDLAIISSTLCTHFYVVNSQFYATFIQIARANQNARKVHGIDGIFTSEIAALPSSSGGLGDFVPIHT
jgi:hypothetical protein